MQVIANSGTATAAKTIDGYWESLEEQLIRAADDSLEEQLIRAADDSLGCKKWKRKGSWFNHEYKEEKEKTQAMRRIMLQTKNKNGKLIADETEAVNVWKNYFETILKPEGEEVAANSDEIGNDEGDVLCPTVEEIKILKPEGEEVAANSDEIGNDEGDVLCPTVEEIKQIISQLKTRKSPGTR
ncbi:hypothetical protein QE152_g13089 [Popillia japonica]|uniref:Uncharacterized protein n=1 Tax=Popillia japonica TaxID=7064 RepID=A0AAW1LB49_POPJA